MFKCLQESLGKPDFGNACSAEVEARGQAMQQDYRLDFGVAEACEPDVDRMCAAEKARHLAARPCNLCSWACESPLIGPSGGSRTGVLLTLCRASASSFIGLSEPCSA